MTEQTDGVSAMSAELGLPKPALVAISPKTGERIEMWTREQMEAHAIAAKAEFEDDAVTLLSVISSSVHWPEEGQQWGVLLSEVVWDDVLELVKRYKQRNGD